MKTNKLKTYISKIQLRTVIIFSLIVFSGSFMVLSSFLTGENEFPSNPGIKEFEELVNELETDPKLSIQSNDPWWDADFIYRRLINVSNPHNEDFNDPNNPFITSINFDYTTLKNTSLKDIRIVENGALRRYYIEKDFPVQNNVTIYFETNCSANTMEQDVFMYYGNNNTDYASNYLMDKNPDGLIWYKFETGLGSTAVDSMNNYNGTLFGTPTWDSTDKAVGSYSLDFDGTSDYIAIQGLNYDTASILTEFTVCVFYKTSYTAGSTNDNWAFFDYDRSEYFNFYITGGSGSSGGRLGFSTSDPTTTFDDDFTSNNGLNDNTWHFGCAKYDGLNGKFIYIDDGALDSSFGDTHAGGVGTGTTRYGFVGDGSEAGSFNAGRNNIYYSGNLDEIRYFEEALSAKRIEWISKNRQLQTEVNEEQLKQATVDIIVKDVDGRTVPGVEVFMFNDTDTSINYTETTNSFGLAEFKNVQNTKYNITANYTINNGTINFEKTVFDSTSLNRHYDFSGLQHTAYVAVSMWSMDFNVDDWNNVSMGYGYILVYNDSAYTDLIAKLPLDRTTGTQRFTWINISDDAKYYYEVYYENSDYNNSITANPFITGNTDRSYYLATKFNDAEIIYVNKTNIEDPALSRFTVQERIYTNFSSHKFLNNTKVINATLILNDMQDQLSSLDIYAIDSNNSISASPIYSETYTTESSDNIKINVTEIADSFGLFIDLRGTNSSQCNGTINIFYNQSYSEYVKMNMSKLVIEVYDSVDNPDPIEGAYINIINGSETSDYGIVTLRTDEFGVAKGQDNPELDFWFITPTKYNFTITYFDVQQDFNVTSDQFSSSDFLDHFNYTLYGNSTIKFYIQNDISSFKTQFQESSWTTTDQWGQNFTFRTRLVKTTNALDDPPTWTPITNPLYVRWEVKDKFADETFYSGNMVSEGGGVYNYTFDTTPLIGNDQYKFVISARKIGFQDPEPEQMLFTVSGKSTGFSILNTTSLTSLGSNVSIYYGEMLYLTAQYSSGGSLLSGASVTYDWQYSAAPVTIAESGGRYSFSVNASEVDVGIYQMKFAASLENYSSVSNYRFDIIVSSRPAFLNNETSLIHISKTLWVKEAYNFTFEYRDALESPYGKIGDLDIATYQWYKVDESGNIIGDISNDTALIEGANQTYILDFNSTSREIGDYAIFVTLQRNNYEVRTALIDLTIRKRVLNLSLTATNLFGNQITIVQGEDATFELTLTDPTNDDAPLLNATVVLSFPSAGLEFELTDEDQDGVYTYTFSSAEINAFFAAAVLTGSINITKDDYISESYPVTMAVTMTEIFPGFPMFYFLMLVISVSAVVGSLVAYRIIQQSRIPTFVKNVRKMKKEIKGRKTISESVLYPSKEDFIVKLLGERWESLGISLADVLGIKVKKAKKLPEAEPTVELETLSEPEASVEESETQVEEDDTKNDEGGVE